MFGHADAGTVKRDVERAGESIADGDLSGAGHDLGKAASHTGDVITGHDKTASEGASDTLHKV